MEKEIENQLFILPQRATRIGKYGDSHYERRKQFQRNTAQELNVLFAHISHQEFHR